MQAGGLQPNNMILMLIILILCSDGQPEQAEEFLSDESDCATYSAVIEGWAMYAKRHTENDEQAQKAVTAVFELMKRMKRRQVFPNAVTYTNVLKAISAARLPESGALALRLLDEMWDSLETKNPVVPSTIHYNTALDCCAKSRRARKAHDCKRLYEEMCESGIARDAITYCTIINAAANSYGSNALKAESFQIGMEAFRELDRDENCEPSSLTFSYLLKLHRRFAPEDERFGLLQEAFDKCCKSGCLNSPILKQLGMALSDDEKKEMFNRREIPKIAELPSQWSHRALKTIAKRSSRY